MIYKRLHHCILAMGIAVVALISQVTSATPATEEKKETVFPAIGKIAQVSFGETVFNLKFESTHTMSFVGIAGPFKGVTDTVEYTAVELRPQVFMVYWHEPHTGMNVVHIEDFERGVVHTNIFPPDGSPLHMSGTLSITGRI